MAFAERMESAPSGAGGLQMHSFGFWQQGFAPGDWSQGVIARNLDGENVSGYRRATDPSHLRASGGHLPDAPDVRPEEIVVENGSLVAGPGADATLAAIGRLVAAVGAESTHDEIDAEALVQPVGSNVYAIELVDTVADASRRAGLDSSPMLAPVRGGEPFQAPATEGGIDELGRPFRRATDPGPQETDAAVSVPVSGFYKDDEASRPLIQSADDFLML